MLLVFHSFKKYHVTPSWSKECLNQGCDLVLILNHFIWLFGYFQYDIIAVTSHRRQSYIFIDSVREYKIPLMICKKHGCWNRCLIYGIYNIAILVTHVACHLAKYQISIMSWYILSYPLYFLRYGGLLNMDIIII